MSVDPSEFEDGEYVDELDDEQDSSGKRTKASSYQLKNVLKLPRATTYSTQALYDQIHAGDIDLEPEYQRDVVWPESKQIGLVDSILRNFYVPPVIFVTHQHEDGSESKTSIDGKQRLTSIQRFMDGMIPHKDPLTGEKYWYKSSAASQSGRSPGMLLPEKYRRLFANKQIVCIEYQDLPDSEEREIFQRVQLGMALTPAEKLQVLSTPMAAFVRKLQSQYLDANSPLGDDALDWDRSRGGDFRCITQALYIIARFPSAATIGAVSQLEKWLHTPTAKANGKGKKKATDDDGDDDDLSKDEIFVERIHGTFRLLSQLVGDASLRPLFLKPEWRVSPVEFVMMCLLVSVDKDNLKPREVATKIGDMRVRVRNEHVDIRMNARVAKTLFEFIKGKPPPSPTEPGAMKNGLKRKREDEDDGAEQSRKEKGRKDEEGGGSTPMRSQTSVLPPPRPDRMGLKEGTKDIPALRVSALKAPPTGPAALRTV
ncbi:hypothetical protein PAXRUDRAFT_826921 [Paxillus rubicundulus Ve08.2h10]|uniref:Unplaced genomic scaffold scaffold_214, whole genome shotgun sequence n=1 Tax=Paxillus rubicundulus Ve08.2h10 TaxID=930991 RepID=A0A0D0E986_9AGAM|nr:hypothetical protein PAXRUDRAFT_826921 [Paxillus rubicundulus Ve08.2h10]